LFVHCAKYLNDHRYDQVKAQLRYQLWQEVRKNNEIVASLYQKVESFRKIFNLILKYYTRVREAVFAIEEMWIFLIESTFNQQSNSIFEKFHKQIFCKDVLGNRYI